MAWLQQLSGLLSPLFGEEPEHPDEPDLEYLQAAKARDLHPSLEARQREYVGHGTASRVRQPPMPPCRDGHRTRRCGQTFGRGPWWWGRGAPLAESTAGIAVLCAVGGGFQCSDSLHFGHTCACWLALQGGSSQGHPCRDRRALPLRLG